VYGIIYKATGPGGKVYVGQTTYSLKKRRSNHKFMSLKGDHRNVFQIALLDEGFDNFTWEQIDTAETAEELNNKEMEWIAFYKANDPQYGYNISKGGPGTGYSPSEKTRKKVSEALKGKPAWNRGRIGVYTEEQLKHMSKAQKGRIITDEHRHKISIAHIGIQNHCTISEETARMIKKDLLNGMRICDAQKKYNVSRKIAADIKHGFSWGSLSVSCQGRRDPRSL
jgi:group I intron endonuclease